MAAPGPGLAVLALCCALGTADLAAAGLEGFWQDGNDAGAWIEYRDGQMIEWLDGRRMAASPYRRVQAPGADAVEDAAGGWLQFDSSGELHERLLTLDQHQLQIERPALGLTVTLRRLATVQDVAAGQPPQLQAMAARPSGGCDPLLSGFDYRASSTLAASAAADYESFRLADGRADTAWVEGVAGDGVDESLTLDLSQLRSQRLQADARLEPVEAVLLQGLQLVNGYAKNPRLYAANGRVARLRLTLDGHYLADWTPADHAAPQAVAFDPPLLLLRTQRLRLSLAAVHAGERYSDTAITELLPIVHDCAQILAVD